MIDYNTLPQAVCRMWKWSTCLKYNVTILTTAGFGSNSTFN